MITAEQLAKLKIDPEWLEPLNDTFQRYDISTPLRMAAFIGQCSHESGNFKVLRENLNYSAERLCKVWPSRFPSLEAAQPFHRNPDMIADKVYSGRMGNNEEGDGALYIGRGCIQLTGKDNYKAVSDALNADLLTTPQLVEKPRYAALTAGWYWNKKGLNALADSNDIETMTKRINGGLIGLEDRKAKINMAFNALA